MRWSLVGVLVAACYAPTPPAGAPCGAGGVCPTGLTCTSDVCTRDTPPADASHPLDGELRNDGPQPGSDAPHADAAPGDQDGDGVPDAIDNCPTVSNASQHDEDHDQLGDACDPCPVNVNNVDSDHDGVGDACDPNPDTAGDAILLFEGFGAPLPSWTSQGTWSVTGDQAVVTTAANEVAWLSPPVASGAAHSTLFAEITIDAFVGTGNRGVGVAAPYATTDSGLECEVGLVAGNNSVRFAGLIDIAAASIKNGGTFAGSTGLFDLAYTRSGTSYTCVASAGGTNGTATTTFTDAATGMALRTRSVNAHYAWVMWVTSP